MPSVGTAYVNVRVNTKGFEAGLDKMLARLSKKMEVGGKKLGDDMAKGMQSSNVEKFFRDMELRAQTASTKMRNDFKKVEGALDDVGLTASDAGDLVNSSFGKTSSTLKSVGNDLQDVSRAAKTVERDASAAGRSVGGIGRGSGGVRTATGDMNFFSRSLQSLSKEGVAARALIARLHDTFAFMGTAVSGAIGGLSSVAQGLFAVGSQAAASAPALGIFTTALIGIAQVGGVLAIAMHGVGAAISAGFKSTDAQAKAAAGSTSALADAVAAASRAVRDAKEGLVNAYQDAARAAEDAARRTADAERALAAAHQATTVAQKELNAAQAEGLQQLKDIGFAAEQASISEDQAALNLQDAYAQLKATSELPPDDRARVEAELAYKQAELNMREAKNSRQQADKDQRHAAKTGLEGTQAVQDAEAKLADARAAQARAQRDLVDARTQQARTAVDNAQSIADAQQNLADAEQRLADARKKGNDATTAAATAADAYKAALDKLSPSQQEFVKKLIALKPQFKAARDEISKPLFEGLTSALGTITKSPLWGQVVDKLTGTSSALGDLIDDGAKAATKPPFSTSLLGAMDSNNKALKIFGDAAGQLAGAFVQVADAAGPTLIKFAEWTKKVTSAWNQTATANNKTGALSDTIERAGNRVKVFKDFFVQLWHWLKIVGGAATDASEDFKWTDKKDDPKGFIPGLTQHLKEFNDQLNKGNLKKDFTQALRNMAAAGHAVKNAVVDPLLLMGHDKRLEEAFNVIGNSDAFDKLATNGGEASVQLAKLVTNLADIAATLSESGSFKIFLGVLKGITGTIAFFLDKVPVSVLKAMGTALGFLAAIRVTTTVGKKLAAALVPPGLDKLPGKIRGAATKAVDAGVYMSEAGQEVAAKFELGFGTGMKEVAVQMGRVVKSALPKTGLISAGNQFVQGLALGIQEATPDVVLATKEMAKSMVSALRSTLKMHSPSVIAMEDGLDFTKSFATGITEGGPLADAAAAEVATGAAGSLGVGKAEAAVEGAAMSTAGGAGAAGAAGAVEGEIGQVGRFSGVLSKFSRFVGPVTKIMKPLALGLRVVGGAFRFMMGPWGMLVFTLLPILWPLLVKLNEKFHILDKTMTVVKFTLGKVGDFFKWLWQEAIQPMFDWVKKNWPLLLGILTGPLGLAVVFITKHWDAIKKIIGDGVSWVLDKLKGMWNGIITGWHHVQDFIRTLWPKHIKPIIKRLLDLAKAQFLLFFGPIIKSWVAVGRFLLNLWRDKVKPKIDDLLSNAHDKLVNFWNGIMDAWHGFMTWLGGRWKAIQTPIENLVSKVSNAVQGIFNGMGEGIIAATNYVGEKLNWLIGKLNDVLGLFGVDDITFRFPTDRVFGGYRFAEGGPVRGRGGPKSDSIMARLSNGEHVWTAREVAAAGGHQKVASLRQAALKGEEPGTGGLFGFVVDKFKDAAGAIAGGAKTAIQWVVGTFVDSLDDSLLGKLVGGAFTWAADHFTSWGKKQDEQAAKSGSDYKGPKTGWTYAVPSNIASYNFSGHNPSTALDIGAPVRTPVRASSGGRIDFIRDLGSESYGLHMVMSHAGGWKTLYAHLSKATARSGQVVRPGTLLGYSGQSGHVTGPHLHLEITKHPGSTYYPDTHSQAVRRGLKWPYEFRLAEGGVVSPVDGGTLALLAEAGRHERVTPLDSEGFTPAEREMLKRLDASMGGGAGGDTFHVHPSERMDEARLADLVARRVAWRRRRGVTRR